MQQSSGDFHETPVSSAEEHVKIDFDLIQDEDGYPPFTCEGMWAVRLDEGRFRLDNIPFFVFGVSCFDIFSALRQEDGRLKFHRVLKAGGHSTLRIILEDILIDQRPDWERFQELREVFRGLGCSSEITPGMMSIDVPPEVSLTKVRAILDDGETKNFWGYEEGTLAYSA